MRDEQRLSITGDGEYLLERSGPVWHEGPFTIGSVSRDRALATLKSTGQEDQHPVSAELEIARCPGVRGTKTGKDGELLAAHRSADWIVVRAEEGHAPGEEELLVLVDGRDRRTWNHETGLARQRIHPEDVLRIAVVDEMIRADEKTVVADRI